MSLTVVGDKDYRAIDIVPIQNAIESIGISDWEIYIGDKMSPLYGYYEDMKNSSVDEVLKKIFELAPNFEILRIIYEDYLELYKKTSLEDNEDDIKEVQKEIDTLEQADSINDGVVKILKDYGIVAIMPRILIPYEKITQDYAIIMGEDKYEPYDNSMLNVNDEEGKVDYTPTYKNEQIEQDGKKKTTIYTELNLALDVVVFSKAQNKFLNITPFIFQIQTNVTISSGGNFSFKLAFNNIYDVESKENYFGYSEGGINDLGYIKALRLQNIFKENDIVYIKFEKLKLEKENENKNIFLKGKNWDMIGLIDQTTIHSDYKSIILTVQGRDLVKLLIDDNNFFIPYQFANNKKTTFGGKSSKIFKRIFSTGEYKQQFIYSLRSIESSIGFVLSQLTNTEILTKSALSKFKEEYNDEAWGKWSKEFVYDKGTKEIKSSDIEGIWGLVDFNVDPKISHYRLCDTKLNTPDGSVYQQIKKLCQYPLVELLCDTYKSKYHIIARKPPFAEEDLKNSYYSVIDTALLISDDLSFDREVYTVFQYSPQGGTLGGNKNFALSYIPMVVLDEYCAIWGNRLYDLTSTYIDVYAYGKTYGKGKNPKETFIEDLIWIIKSFAIKPFTRCGTITLRGDRRIKAGSYIYLQKTDEVFYVDAVAQSAQIMGNEIQRVTTLNVSRGMVRKYIPSIESNLSTIEGGNLTIIGKSFYQYSDEQNAPDGQGFTSRIDDNFMKDSTETKFPISYFNLIDETYLRESLKNNLIEVDRAFSLKRVEEATQSNPEANIGTESIVVGGVFEFFLNGKQFEKRK